MTTDMLDEQQYFVDWWRANVTPNRKRKSVVSDQIQQTVGAVEAATGITKLQVSRWATS